MSGFFKAFWALLEETGQGLMFLLTVVTRLWDSAYFILQGLAYIILIIVMLMIIFYILKALTDEKR